MKNLSRFALELIVTIVVAALLTAVLDLALLFVVGNMNAGVKMNTIVNAASGTLFGLIIGYKLNTLLREHKV